MAYKQTNNPFDVTGCGRRRTFMVEDSYNIDSPLEKRKRKRKPDVRRTIGPGKNFNKARSTGTGGKAGGGMTEKENHSALDQKVGKVKEV